MKPFSLLKEKKFEQFFSNRQSKKYWFFFSFFRQKKANSLCTDDFFWASNFPLHYLESVLSKLFWKNIFLCICCFHIQYGRLLYKKIWYLIGVTVQCLEQKWLSWLLKVFYALKLILFTRLILKEIELAS